MEPIDPDAIYTLTQAFPLSGVSYARFSAALSRGDLPSTRSKRWAYQIRGSDLMTWRDRVHGEWPEPPESQTSPGPRETLIEILRRLSDEEIAVLLHMAQWMRDDSW
jgi:hypothetical protein